MQQLIRRENRKVRLQLAKKYRKMCHTSSRTKFYGLMREILTSKVMEGQRVEKKSGGSCLGLTNLY